MKSIKALSAIVLACAMALCLFACAPEDDTPEQAAQTPLAIAQSAPLAYLNALIGLVKGAEGFTMEAPYGMDDIEIGNDTLKAAKDVVKGYVTSYLNSSFGYEKGKTTDAEASCPALFYALRAEDLLEDLVISDVLELRVAERLVNLEADIAENRNTSMKGKTDQEKREYVLEQMGENAVLDAGQQYQIEGKLSLAAVDKLFPTADKADILAQLAKAETYIVVDDYAVEPTELTLFATVFKTTVDADKFAAQQVKDPAQTTNHIRELTFTQKANLTAEAAGAGAFEGTGEFPISLTLTKTLRFKDIAWEKAAE